MTEPQLSTMDKSSNVEDDPSGWTWHGDPANGDADEPTVDVPAGLLRQAIELLGLCDDLINHPGHDTIDDRIRTVINRHQPSGAATLRWFHHSLGAAAADLQELLDDTGIIVEAEIRGRPGHR